MAAVFECKNCEDGNDYIICHLFVEYDESVKNPTFCPYTRGNASWYRLVGE